MFVEEYRSKVQPVLESGEDELLESEIPIEEQKEAEHYVLHKEMFRPTTSIMTFLIWFTVALLTALGLTVLFCAFCVFKLENIASLFKNSIQEKSFLFFFFVFLSAFIIVLFGFRNFIAVGFIHLYQHYSPEEKRRSCLFKPTCSEYAVIAINKYGVGRALPRIISRCKRCHGSVYRIDYP